MAILGTVVALNGAAIVVDVNGVRRQLHLGDTIQTGDVVITLAGVLGNTQSRIFCFDLQAELISIAGNYKVNDDLDKSIQHKPVQIYLQDLALIIKEL